MPSPPRPRGRPRKNWEGSKGISVSGFEQVLSFLAEADTTIADFAEELVDKLARNMMEANVNNPASIKRRATAGKGYGVPVDTGRLLAVFGAVDGKPNYRYLTTPNSRAYAKSPKPLEDDVIWEKVGRYQMNMGTTLYYSGIVQMRYDFVGSYLRASHDHIERKAQNITNYWLIKMGKKHGFSAKHSRGVTGLDES